MTGAFELAANFSLTEFQNREAQNTFTYFETRLQPASRSFVAFSSEGSLRLLDYLKEL
jgi:hypothetical protein